VKAASMDRAMSLTASAVPGCPNQGGILDSISVPVNQSINLDCCYLRSRTSWWRSLPAQL
jgi:hypothetical protein